jgi:hypothetical protein
MVDGWLAVDALLVTSPDRTEGWALRSRRYYDV